MLTNLRVGAHERTSDLRVWGLTASNFQTLCFCLWLICVLRAEIWRWRLTSVLSKVPQIQNHKYLVLLLQKFPPRLSVNITADSISLATNPLIFFFSIYLLFVWLLKNPKLHIWNTNRKTRQRKAAKSHILSLRPANVWRLSFKVSEMMLGFLSVPSEFFQYLYFYRFIERILVF